MNREVLFAVRWGVVLSPFFSSSGWMYVSLRMWWYHICLKHSERWREREWETAEVLSDENNLSVYQSMCVIAHRKRHFEKPEMKRKDKKKIGKQNQPPLISHWLWSLVYKSQCQQLETERRELERGWWGKKELIKINCLH